MFSEVLSLCHFPRQIPPINLKIDFLETMNALRGLIIRELVFVSHGPQLWIRSSSDVALRRID